MLTQEELDYWRAVGTGLAALAVVLLALIGGGALW